MRFPHLAHRSAAAHKLHSPPQQHAMNLISGNDQTSSRLPAFSLFLPGSCPNYRDRRTLPAPSIEIVKAVPRMASSQSRPQTPLSHQTRELIFLFQQSTTFAAPVQCAVPTYRSNAEASPQDGHAGSVVKVIFLPNSNESRRRISSLS